MTQSFYNQLENCLARMNAGEDLESVLKHYPQQADQLRPLLNAAARARQSGMPLRIPASAQIDSRARFLLEAQHREGKPAVFMPRLSFAAAAVAVVVVLIAGIFGTALASASSIPGQTLYPVKLAVEQAQMTLTTDQSARLDLQEKFDRRRLAEAEELEKEGRTQPVTVAGPLEETTDHAWRVGGVKLNLSQGQEALASSLNGSYIEVKGEVRGGEDGIEVDSLSLRFFPFSGVIQSIQGNQWIVSGVNVLVPETAKITGKPEVGNRVELITLRYEQDIFTALKATVFNKSNTGRNEELNKGSQSEPDKSDADKKTPLIETPAPKETEPDKPMEGTKTPESGGEFHSTETPRPTEVPEPTRTPD